jgi:phage shock protein PspC (stress-responsive transcriptional regulator)
MTLIHSEGDEVTQHDDRIHSAAAFEQHGCDYGVGGAVALGHWGEPRGTIDVDVTVYLSPDEPEAFVRLLREVGCTVDPTAALDSLREHGFCRVTFEGIRVDIFLPTIPFYEEARRRRRSVRLGAGSIMVWDAETLAVFTMMFFRRRDVADVEQMLRIQGGGLDRGWVEGQLQGIYGRRDPRLAQWRELTPGSSAAETWYRMDGPAHAMDTPRPRLQRSSQDAVIAGVCGGIAQWLGWDPTVVRVAYVLLSILSAAFPGILVYLILWLLMPREEQ